MVSIFIVDDEETLHQVYKALFAVRGHTVVGSAFDGDEAIQTLSKLHPKPDVIIMDHRMPHMDGITATKLLLSLHPSIKIIFVSADETVCHEALEAGATIFQVKPVRARELFRIVDRVTNKS